MATPKTSSQIGEAQIGVAQIGAGAPSQSGGGGGGGGGTALLLVRADMTGGFQSGEMNGGFNG